MSPVPLSLKTTGNARVDEPSTGRATWVHHEPVMGTVITFDVGYDGAGSTPPPGLLRLIAQARALLRTIDAVFSLWKPGSPMSNLRRGSITIADAPPEIAEVLSLCEQARRLTHGWFDAGALPGGLDPTGIVKGWAAERALEVLVRGGFHDVLVNAAGDLVASGSPGPFPGAGGLDATPPWRIGIRHPRDANALVAVATIGGTSGMRAVATSGTYERGAHLYDPHSRRPAARFASASVSGPELWLADAAATALAVAGADGYGFIGELDGYEALTIDYQDSVRVSPGFPLAREG